MIRVNFKNGSRIDRVFKRSVMWILIPLSCATTEDQVLPSAKLEKAVELKSGKTVMKISANGGRIISFKYGEEEILTQASDHENFGSTLWTAPQSAWGWPPYAVLDKQEYTVVQKGDLLIMTSQHDSESGFQMVKSWQVMDEQKFLVSYQIKNLSQRPKSVGAWAVTRVPCGGLAFFPDGGKGNVPESSLKIELQENGINWIAINKTPIADHQKLFATASGGWLAYAWNGLLFIKQFPDTNPEDYSPQQGEVEIYLNKDKHYAEVENHGAYQLLEPGQSLNYTENWFLIPVPADTNGTPGNKTLIDMARRQIAPAKHIK